ncbi:MAG: ASPIC/UnbV domain-containing protein, partial [Gammaproteobacteria bacterium]
LRLGYQRGAALGDLNGDGFLDIVVTSLGEKPRMLINSAGNANHWLMLDLRGRRSNRDAIGAMVELTTASGRKLHNHVTTSVGFLSSSDKRVHFGLGPERVIRSLLIRWPSGITQSVSNPRADRVMIIEEGVGTDPRGTVFRFRGQETPRVPPAPQNLHPGFPRSDSR